MTISTPHGRGFLRLPAAAVLLGLLTLAVVLGFVAGGSTPAQAATFTVNSTGDGGDSNTADGVCDDGTGACTLRAAIEQANATAGADTINFSIGGGGVQTIAPGSALPTITDPVTVDGYTQPGSSPNTLANGDDAVLLIELDGVNAGLGIDGLRITAGNSTVRGLVINSSRSNGIFLVTGGGNVIEGNFIGTDVTGTSALGNVFRGVEISQSSNNIIGGTTVAARNIISGNSKNGIQIGTGRENRIEGNFIGTDVTGTSALGNGGNGVEIFNGASGNTIGGTASGAGNVIAFNGSRGVLIGVSDTGNAIVSNSIFSNVKLGIDLRPLGVTLNDDGDGDTGANNLQNFPVLTSATSGSSTTIEGTLNSTANTTFRLEFFANAACDPSGHGEGETFLGSADVTTDASGGVSFSATLPTTAPADQGVITATATDPSNNTSEFSACIVAEVEIDSDGDGVVDGEDACPTTAGLSDRQGCPVGDANTVELHVVDQAKPKTACPDGKGSCKEPITGAGVRVFDRNILNGLTITKLDASTLTLTKNPNGSLYDDIFEAAEANVAQVGTCTTGVTGTCIAGEETTGDYLVIVKYEDAETGKTVYTGKPKSPGDFDATGLASKDFQVIKVLKKDLTVQFSGGSKTVVTGSYLEVVHPDLAIWEDVAAGYVYPFIFTSDSDWTVDVCAYVPTGYAIVGVYDENGDLLTDSSCAQTFVSGETKVAAFDVIEVGSPEPVLGVLLTVEHEGTVTEVDIEVPGERTYVEEPAAQPAQLPTTGAGESGDGTPVWPVVAALAGVSVMLLGGVVVWRRRRA